MFKNVASQKLIVFAFDSTTNLPKTGDAANLSGYVSKDFGTVTVLADTSATEMDATNAKGYYLFDLAQGETNGDTLLFSAKSSTSNIVVIAQPPTVYTYPNRFSTLVIDSAGLADANTVKLGPSGSGTAQTARDVGTSVLLSSGTGTGQLDFTSGVVKANVVQLLGTAWLTPGTAGTPDVNAKLHGGTSQTGRDIGASVLLSSGTGTGQLKLASGYVAMTWADIAAPTTTVALSGTTVATVTGQLTAAQIATAVWQDATAGDFTTASSIGKCLYIANVAPGANGGHFIAGSNAGTTTFGAMTITGAFTVGSTSGFGTAQTGDSYTRIGAAGAGLTALGDTRIANLDATVSSRGTSTLTQTQVTGGAYSVQSASCVLGDARIANLASGDGYILLSSGTYGLAALAEKLNSIEVVTDRLYRS